MANPSSVGRLGLPSTGDLTSVGDLRTALLERLDAGQSVHLEANLAEEPSTSLVQVIEAAAMAFGARGLHVRLVDPSDSLCTAYEDLGLFSALMSRIAESN